ncbi:MAG: hypothetical protein LAT62_15290, partial [Natronospirillum sp.]|nr:hypothetical protein [Natronospirillum sp.]
VHALWALPLFPAGMLLNLVLIPWVSFVTLPLALLTAVGLPWANVLFGWAIDVWRWLLAVFDHLIAFLPALSPLQAVILGLLAALALLTRWSFAGWTLLVISGFALLLAQARPPVLADHEFEVWVLDSGAGQTVVVETATGRVLIDSGSGTGQTVNLSQPVLRWHWARPLQDWHTVVLSRPGRQTQGGLNALAAVSQSPSQTFASRPTRGDHWPENWPDARFCDLNTRFELADVSFRFLRPLPGFQPEGTRTGSCVLEVRSRAGSALIVNGGDVVAAHALAQSGQLSATDLLAVGGDPAAALPLREVTRAAHLVFQQPMHADLPSAMTEGTWTEDYVSPENSAVCTCGQKSWRYRFTDLGIIPLSYGLRLLPWLRI